MIARFNGNVVPFADDATSTNRTVFGGVTQSDAIDDNLNADFKKGWEIVGLNDNPTREDFNGMGYTLGALISYIYEMGISEWNTSQNYRVNSRVIGSNGKLYKALTGTIGSPNVGKNPTSDAVNWQLEIITDYSTLTNKATPIDADLIALGDSTSSFSLKKLTWANIKATLKTYFDTLYVTLSENQTIAGVKTFTSSPIVPTPTAQDNSTKVATTAYVDGKMVLRTAVNSTSGTSIDFTGIPNWVKRITIMFKGISTTGSSPMIIRIGTSAGFETSGYISSYDLFQSSVGVIFTSVGFGIADPTASNLLHGSMSICKINGNDWVSTSLGTIDTAGLSLSAGSKSLSGTLDKVRITTINGTDTFDSGSINIMYEG